jgi:hypothetical protein
LPGWSCFRLDVLLKADKSLKVKFSRSSYRSKSLHRVLTFPNSRGVAFCRRASKSYNPCRRMKMRLAYRFSPRIVAEMAPSRFYRNRALGSFFNSSIISSAPTLMDSFWVWASFWLVEAYIWRAIYREWSSLE